VPAARANATTHDLVLGNAALADAALQVVQACMPGRRMLVAGCDSVWFSDAFCTGQIADGQVTIAVGQEEAAGAEATAGSHGDACGPAESASAGAVPRPRRGGGERAVSAAGPAWQMRVTDAAGRLLIAWNGLRMRDVGPLLQPSRPEPSRLSRAD
jgi:hypothetical protein